MGRPPRSREYLNSHKVYPHTVERVRASPTPSRIRTRTALDSRFPVGMRRGPRKPRPVTPRETAIARLEIGNATYPRLRPGNCQLPGRIARIIGSDAYRAGQELKDTGILPARIARRSERSSRWYGDYGDCGTIASKVLRDYWYHSVE